MSVLCCVVCTLYTSLLFYSLWLYAEFPRAKFQNTYDALKIMDLRLTDGNKIGSTVLPPVHYAHARGNSKISKFNRLAVSLYAYG